MTELSLTAQTVWHAFRDATNCAENKLAAALHAAADQVVPESTTHHLGEDWVRKIQREQRAAIRLEL